ncbi:hypothetical protein Clacol_005059 [Clathrus columnatus]|uniref:Uncharacterized protein n=1 Tax=Clathrus columnatus TaxID=1419009 RepID=A0AAV5A875_9AGAM|nr:hypothetical protein Clacol_005059 [Clathrus columnatus]
MPLTKNNNLNNKTYNNGHSGPGTATGAALGGAVGHHEGHTATGALLGGAAGHHHQANQHAIADPAVRPSGIHDPGQMNAPGATTTINGVSVPASGAMNNGNKASASEKAFIGKLEHAAGTLLCSSTLKAKGIQKEQEAQALKVQSAEITAAQRLEQEARARRERAVAHGADPQVLQTMGGNNNVGAGQGVSGGAMGNSNMNTMPQPQMNQNQVPNNVYPHDHHTGRYPAVGLSTT